MNPRRFSGVVSLLCLAPLLAQTPPADPLPVLEPLSVIRRPIPLDVGGDHIAKIVRFDADGDLIQDVGILWSTGEVTFGYAPRILPSFVNSPFESATDIARVPGGSGDLLLVADGVQLHTMAFDPTLPLPTATEDRLLVGNVTASPAWDTVVRVTAQTADGTTWLVGVEADYRTVHVGTWNALEITDVGVTTASEDVQQTMLVDFLRDGSRTLALRTRWGLEMWTPTGAPLWMQAAPCVNHHGALAEVRDGPVNRLAWMVTSGSGWLLRVLNGPILTQEMAVQRSELFPNRFSLVSLGAMPRPGRTADALVLCQNSTQSQAVLTVDESMQDTGYVPSSSFEVPDITLLTDDCPALLDDFNSDGTADVTTALTSQRCLQIQTEVPVALDVATENAAGREDEFFVQAGHFAPESGTIDLDILVPGTSTDGTFLHTMPNLFAQVAVWRQVVADPEDPSPVEDPMSFRYPLLDMGSNNAGNLDHPVLPVAVQPALAAWDPTNHYYLAVRLVQFEGDTVLWSSPVQVVALVVGPEDPAPSIAYLLQIIPAGAPLNQLSFNDGGNRNAGIIVRPPDLQPPTDSAMVPAIGESTSIQPRGEW